MGGRPLRLPEILLGGGLVFVLAAPEVAHVRPGGADAAAVGVFVVAVAFVMVGLWVGLSVWSTIDG